MDRTLKNLQAVPQGRVSVSTCQGIGGGVGVGWEQDKPDKGKFSVVVIDSICGNSYVKIHLGPGIFLL